MFRHSVHGGDGMLKDDTQEQDGESQYHYTISNERKINGGDDVSLSLSGSLSAVCPPSDCRSLRELQRLHVAFVLIKASQIDWITTV